MTYKDISQGTQQFSNTQHNSLEIPITYGFEWIALITPKASDSTQTLDRLGNLVANFNASLIAKASVANREEQNIFIEILSIISPL